MLVIVKNKVNMLLFQKILILSHDCNLFKVMQGILYSLTYSCRSEKKYFIVVNHFQRDTNADEDLVRMN